MRARFFLSQDRLAGSPSISSFAAEARTFPPLIPGGLGGEHLLVRDEAVRGRLAGAGASADEQVPARESEGKRARLDGRGVHVAQPPDGLEETAVQACGGAGEGVWGEKKK